jgi:hypothetical protein
LLVNWFVSLTSFYNPVPQELRSLGITAHPEEDTLSHGTQESACLLTSGEKVFLSLQALKDANQVLHHQIAYVKTVGGKGKKRTKTQPCGLCLTNDNKCWLVRFGCYTCQKTFCCPNGSNGRRDCFKDHVRAVCQRTNRQTTAATTE